MADEKVRRPERELTVLWQRHLPEGYGTPVRRGGTVESDDLRINAIIHLADHVEKALEEHMDALDYGDLVVTISRRPSLQSVPDPRDLIVGYGEKQRGDLKRYVLVTRVFRPDGTRVETPRTVVFQSDSKPEVIAEAQRRKGWTPVDGSERTYARQIDEHAGEAR